ETLSTYLLDNGFQRGQIDKTLFIKRFKGDILLVQVYVDDIIFGSIRKELCTEFEKLMHKRFQMSSKRELTFFLGLQVMQKDDGIFISQDKYVDEILKKFGFSTVKIASTPMETSNPLLKDENAKDVDVNLYRSMIGSLMYLTSSSRLISWQCKKQTVVANSTTKAEYVAAANCCGQCCWHDLMLLGEKLVLPGKKLMLLGQVNTARLPLGIQMLRVSFADLIFADSHNMAAYLEKSEDNADFAEIVDFLNASPIRYALTVSPTVYVSYIEQFWFTVKIKTVNNERQICAKVDGKTIVITESSVRRDLHFNDEDGITCLINTEIFENLQLMGFKSTAWNEFGINIASAVICLAKKQKFNFSKLIFDAPFNDEYATPSHTKKVFANMRRQRKDFPGTVTPLFAAMLIQSQAMEGEEPIPIVASSSQPKKTHKHRKTKRKATEISQSSRPTTLVADEIIHEERGDNVERAATTTASLDSEQDSGGSPRRQDTILGDRPAQTRFERLSKQSNEPPLSRVNTLRSEEDSMQLQELMDLYTKLSKRVLDLENVKNVQSLEIQKLKKRVKKLESRKKSRTPQLKRRLFKVRIKSSAEKSLGDPEDASKQGRNEIDQDEGGSWF
ncbi:putative ribonuclease H-like domain-containing protein, partial [Tanacetum coccineum]